jgi:hypothetical protein
MDLQKQATILIHEKKQGLAKEYMALIRDYYEDLYEEEPLKPQNWKAVCEIRILSGILYESDPDNPEYRSILGVLYAQSGISDHQAGEFDKSKDAFEKSISINSKLFDEEPDNFLYMGTLAAVFSEYSKLLTSLGRKEEAEEYTAKVEGITR